MASGKPYLDFILDQLSPLSDVSFKPMMGEYLIYCRGKLVGGIYDNRFLVKPTEVARRLMPDAPLELPYEGAKAMLLVEEIDDQAFFCGLIDALADEPSPSGKRQPAALAPGDTSRPS